MIAARIESDHFYDDVWLKLTLGVPYNTSKRARQAGQLRSTRRGGRILFRGSWVEEWLAGAAPEDSGRKAVAAC